MKSFVVKVDKQSPCFTSLYEYVLSIVKTDKEEHTRLFREYLESIPVSSIRIIINPGTRQVDSIMQVLLERKKRSLRGRFEGVRGKRLTKEQREEFISGQQKGEPLIELLQTIFAD
nr:hypothetical protein Cbor_29 [Cedratvirus borely]WIL03370.1 hypothetical protein Cplu_24 [Cedratvirus plubellavi]